eukprot:gnl/MRDRNA2_/MRDRNA2_243348_c0_seq1.p1 gnl/MRDRNA2_/MRDRNA2_243348_c0~~gnl/MRDRNA2_/MRDRNA2_243348_c0_seq1.p1  ORF type:complete len:215 (-),score=32.41 gnl/MRDRNA2_/MRDRNA2_243348_c0_seq1:52-696(-)
MFTENGFDASILLGCEEYDARNILTELGSVISGFGVVDSRLFSDCLYLNCKSLGVSVHVTPANDGTVDAVFLYNEGKHGFKQYTAGCLPEGFDWTTTQNQVLKCMPDSSRKGNGPELWIENDSKGLAFSFYGSSWDEIDSKIAFVTIFSVKICTRCAKIARERHLPKETWGKSCFPECPFATCSSGGNLLQRCAPMDVASRIAAETEISLDAMD